VPQTAKSAHRSAQSGWFARARRWYRIQADGVKEIWRQAQAEKRSAPENPKPIGAVLDEELAEIVKSREKRLEDPGSPPPGPLTKPENLVGLSFSGGGIRSATFNLGVTTGLAKRGYLKHVDYLSTVSGGGYIGSWLTAWIKRAGCKEVEDRLSGREGNLLEEKMEAPTVFRTAEYPRYQEPDPVRFLRRFSNYLAPKTGLLSTDLWALIAVYLRNVMLNLTLLIAAGAFVLALPLFGIHWGRRLLGYDLTATLMWVIRVLLVVAMSAIAYSFASFSSEVQKHSKLGAIVNRPGWWVVAPLLAASGCMTYILTPDLRERIDCIARELRLDRVGAPETGWFMHHLPAWISSAYRWLSVKSDHPEMLGWVIEGAIAYTIIWLVGNLIAQWIEVYALWKAGALRNLGSIVRKMWEIGKVFFGKGAGPNPIAGSKTVSLLAAMLSGALGGLLLYAFGQFLGNMPGTLWKSLDQQPGTIPFYGYAAFSTVLGPALLLWTVALVSVLHVGLLGRSFPDAKREWLSRLCAMLALTALAWVVVVGLSLYGAMIFKFLFLSSWAKSTWGSVVKWILASGWVTATAGGVIGGNMSKAAPQKGNGTGLLLKLAPVVFILGLLLLL
jgi:hypothetical protein